MTRTPAADGPVPSGRGRPGHLDGSQGARHAVAVTELGTCVHLRDVVTIDIGDVTAPEPVEPGDLVASVDELYRVEAVLAPAPGARAVPELARVVELAPA